MEQSFEGQLRRAILQSERKRVFIVAGVLSLMLMVFVVGTALNPALLPTPGAGVVPSSSKSILADCTRFSTIRASGHVIPERTSTSRVRVRANCAKRT